MMYVLTTSRSSLRLSLRQAAEHCDSISENYLGQCSVQQTTISHYFISDLWYAIAMHEAFLHDEGKRKEGKITHHPQPLTADSMYQHLACSQDNPW